MVSFVPNDDEFSDVGDDHSMKRIRREEQNRELSKGANLDEAFFPSKKERKQNENADRKMPLMQNPIINTDWNAC